MKFILKCLKTHIKNFKILSPFCMAMHHNTCSYSCKVVFIRIPIVDRYEERLVVHKIQFVQNSSVLSSFPSIISSYVVRKKKTRTGLEDEVNYNLVGLIHTLPPPKCWFGYQEATYF